MKHPAPKCMTQWLKIPTFLVLSGPVAAWAGLTKPLRNVPDHLGSGVYAVDHYWSLAGLIGFVVVIGLLAGFYRRDREE